MPKQSQDMSRASHAYSVPPACLSRLSPMAQFILFILLSCRNTNLNQDDSLYE